MGVMDQGFKAWLELCKEEVLPWLLGQPVTYLGTFPTELAPAPQLLPDRIYRVRVGQQNCLVNLEVQTTIDPTMGRRMYEYGTRADIDSGLPVYSVVLWLFKDPQGHRPPKSPYQRIITGRVVATWAFVNIELYRLTPDVMMKAGAVGLLPLLPFTQGATPELIEAAMQRVKEEAPAEQVKPLAGLLGVFTSRFYGKALALALFERLFMSTEILQEFPLFRDMMAEAEARGEAKGKAEGLEQGKAEGLEQGKAEGLREAARLGLASRFGPLSAETQAALSQADEATLRAILTHLASDSLEQLRARLGLSSAQG